MGQMLDMAVELDPVASRENNTLAPVSIVRQFFERSSRKCCGKMEPLPPFDWRCFVVQTDDDNVHCSAAILLYETGSPAHAGEPHLS